MDNDRNDRIWNQWILHEILNQKLNFQTQHNSHNFLLSIWDSSMDAVECSFHKMSSLKHCVLFVVAWQNASRMNTKKLNCKMVILNEWIYSRKDGVCFRKWGSCISHGYKWCIFSYSVFLHIQIPPGPNKFMDPIWTWLAIWLKQYRNDAQHIHIQTPNETPNYPI